MGGLAAQRAGDLYRGVSKRLVERASRDGAVPNGLFPIFRNREELRQSRYLIVICSPKSAVSRWVNEEIKTFKALGREERTLCLIVDGKPNATDKPENWECRSVFAERSDFTSARTGN